MPTTMKLVAKNVLGSDTASMTFSDLPSTYTDLYIVCSMRSDRATVWDDLRMRVNGATSDTNHSGRFVQGNGASASSGTLAYIGASINGNNSTTNTFSNVEFYIPNYAGSTAKSMSQTEVAETNATTAYISAFAFLWNSTAAITSLRFDSTNAANFRSGSSICIYGITKA